MATVYSARDLKHNRPVAVKLLQPELATSLGVDRFLREIQIAALGKTLSRDLLSFQNTFEGSGRFIHIVVSPRDSKTKTQVTEGAGFHTALFVSATIVSGIFRTLIGKRRRALNALLDRLSVCVARPDARQGDRP